MTRLAAFATALVLSFTMLLCGSVRAENLEQSMTTEEFKAAGLDKLSAEELARLNQWLSRKLGQTATPAGSAAPAAAVASESKPVDTGPHIAAKYRSPEDRATMPSNNEVHSRIVGYFNGWHKNAIFKLENGQHWRVTDDRRYNASAIDSPEITIEPGFMGAWYFSIDGSNRTARVERIK